MTAEDEKPGTFSPYDIDVEQAVIAAILRQPRLLVEVAAEVEPRDFFDNLHSKIFERMLVLDELEKPVSVLSVRAGLKNDPLFIEATKAQQDNAINFETASLDYIEAIYQAAPAVRDGLADYCRTIVEYRIHRDALNATWEAYHQLEGGAPPERAVELVRVVGDELVHRQQARRGPVDMGTAFDNLAAQAELSAQGKMPGGCPSGSKKLDKQIGGYFPEDFIIIAGRPGMGKSILGTTALKAAAQARDALGHRIYEPIGFSLEMSAKWNVARLIADLDYDDALRQGRAPMEFADIFRGKLDGEQWERFVLLGQELRDWGIDLYDESKMTVAKISALARAKASRTNRKVLVMVDHLQIIGASDRYRGNRLEELTQTTGELKALAKRLDSPVVALSQLSRGVESREDKRPVLSDLRESGSIEQDADTVLFLYRPAYYLRTKIKHARATGARNLVDLELELERDAHLLEVDAAKCRNGAPGDVRLWVDVASSAIRDEEPPRGRPRDDLLTRAGEPLDLVDLDRRTGAKP